MTKYEYGLYPITESETILGMLDMIGQINYPGWWDATAVWYDILDMWELYDERSISWIVFIDYYRWKLSQGKRELNWDDEGGLVALDKFIELIEMVNINHD